jgi:hypothetical protein
MDMRHSPFTSQPVQRIWILATCCESGMSTTIHRTEHEAYAKLAEAWFGADGECGGDTSSHSAMLAALDQSCEAAKDWFEEYQLGEDASGDAIIEPHDPSDVSLKTQSQN